MKGAYLVLCFIDILLVTPTLCDERGGRVKRIVGGSPADPPPVDDPVVFTNFNGKSARIQGVRAFPHYHFRGIKYAFPPVGQDRFLRPRQKFLEGMVNATMYPPPCYQPRPGTDMVIGSEDCLALNVFTPELPRGTEGLPVVVWIHGGGFRYGSASQYGVRHLVGKQLVVVTIQFRLGSLGFLSTGDKNLPGNVALWDMVLAVQWVRNYIGFFGGNPYRIFVMGHDTGASSALLMTLSNVAKGLPAGVIAMSGTAVSNWALDNTPRNTAKEIADQNGCPTLDPVTMVKCLQNLPADSIVRGDSNVEVIRLQSRGFMSGLSGGVGSAPVAEGYNDGRSLPGLVEGEPLTEMNKKHHPKIPLLTGICKDETKRAVEGQFKTDIAKKLLKSPNFLDEDLIKNLRGMLPIDSIQDNINNTLNNLIPLNFRNYVKHEAQNLVQALDKVAEVTGDVLFNVPAFLTVNRWSTNGAKTFLYSFEHFGKRLKGDAFLRGSPLVGNGTYSDDVNATVGHGDDLSYLFDAHDMYGEPLDDDKNRNEDDETVREIFTQMIADFVRHGTPRINKQDVKPFSLGQNNFIQIKPRPTLANNFKFCEMALWFNMADRLKSASCNFLDAFSKNLKNAAGALNDVLNKTALNLHNGNVLGENHSSLPLLGGNNNNGGGIVPGLLSGNIQQSDNKRNREFSGGNQPDRNGRKQNRGPLDILNPAPRSNQNSNNRNLGGLGNIIG